MWSHYANWHNGITIGFDRNYNFLSSASNILYSKNPKTINCSLLKNHENKNLIQQEFKDIILTKHISWSYEEEYRCVFNSIQLKEYLSSFKNELFTQNKNWSNCIMQLKNNEEKIDLPINPKAIKSVYIGMKTHKDDENIILNLIQQQNLNINLYKAIKNNDSCKIDFKPIIHT